MAGRSGWRALAPAGLLVLVLAGSVASAQAPREAEPNTRVPEGDRGHAAGAYPDRIATSPAQDAATGFAVAWRTDARVQAPRLQIAPADDSPDIGEGRPRVVEATTRPLDTRNGRAHQHRADVDGLQPGTLYAWRVEGHRTWSPWFHFRTAAADAAPLTLLYFGDTQNQNTSLVTRVVRESRRWAPDARLALFAGDLVSGGGAGMGADDDEWAEWFEAASGLPEDIATAPAVGNHEFHQAHEDTPQETRVLSPHWPLAFALPRNGAPGFEDTTYWFDYQGVRFVVLDGTSILDLDGGPAQARWLDHVLTGNPHRWSVVQIHQPLYALRFDRDYAPLREHLAPVLRKHHVDLVLQGHDHGYGRRPLDEDARAGTPQLVVSVVGAKQYRLGPQALATMAPIGEDTQLFQVLRFDGPVLRYEARTATGRLYDAFELHDDGDGGSKRLVETEEGRIAPRRCTREASLKGREDRCWE
ncbi:metallophosphoesterase family protein [Luteimonas sp. BDR2-5]|nr:metallophosphoesterase family protein [Luteimonas sp. BDR2-5]MCD9029427.1 metallophosphoesterase family protein [Luteimonas sp. BDR2-5]